jgi:hypothetical protein
MHGCKVRAEEHSRWFGQQRGRRGVAVWGSNEKRDIENGRGPARHGMQVIGVGMGSRRPSVYIISVGGGKWEGMSKI